ncbi:MAG: hypothetical protein R3Y58_03655 [Eubacteriales bacterium]
MDDKMPYYVAHPFSEIWNEEKMCKRDREYMQSIYPEIAKLFLPFVEKECDRLEYDGSLVFDEYPDKLLLRLMCGRVYNLAIDELGKQGICFEGIEKQWAKEMIEILLYQELCRRRELYRSNRRRWF